MLFSCAIDSKIMFGTIDFQETDIFQEGLRRVRQGMKSYRIGLMCAEKDPLTCHRTILVCRHLRGDGIRIRHILEDYSIEENDETFKRLMRLLKLPERDLFASPEEMIERAYDVQGDKIAFVPKDDENSAQNGKRRS